MIVVLALCCVVLQATYLPLPVSVQKDLSVAFPCQSSGCGCKNAQQCWESCCCHNDQEKLAWARRHEVTPPSWFLEKIEVTFEDIVVTSCSTKRISCCATSTVVSPVVKAKKSSGCCSSDGKSKAMQAEPAPESRSESVPLCWKQMQDCRGEDTGLTHQKLLFVTPPAEPDVSEFSSPLLAVIELPFLSVGTPPPAPPPDLTITTFFV